MNDVLAGFEAVIGFELHLGAFSEIKTGLSATGDIVFEIPTDASCLMLTVKPSIFSGKKATINLE